MTTHQTEVCIVGAGPVGLALAIELRGHGVDCLVIERRRRTSIQPRAKLTNIRSMELLRRCGLADQVRAAAPLPDDYPSHIVFTTRLLGWELARFPNALSTALDPDAPFPEPAQQIPQPYLESVLLSHARELGARVEMGWELTDIDHHDGGGVTAIVERDGGRPAAIKAGYLAGCDGARSTVRRLLGIEMTGKGKLGRNLGIVFDAPGLSARHPHGPAVHYWCVNPDVPAILGPLDGADRWWFQATAIPDEVDVATVDLHDMVETAIGGPCDIDIVGSDPWTAHTRLADRYRVGNAFILGDAAHLHPPMGGYGMNMGIGDAVDLGWKLGAVANGWAVPTILDTYETERRPVHQRVLEESTTNYRLIANDLLARGLEHPDTDGADTRARVGELILTKKAQEFRSIGMQLGYRYETSPLVMAEPTPEPPHRVDQYQPCARPGHRAPHAWVAPGQSTLDAYQTTYTLLSMGADVSAIDTLRTAAADASMPLRHELAEPSLAELHGASLVLVRPDQHVAWRGDHIDPSLAASIVATARGARVRPHAGATS